MGFASEVKFDSGSKMYTGKGAVPYCCMSLYLMLIIGVKEFVHLACLLLSDENLMCAETSVSVKEFGLCIADSDRLIAPYQYWYRSFPKTGQRVKSL